MAIRREPAIIIDDAAFTDVYARRVVRWERVRAVHRTERASIGGRYHRLVFTVAADASAIGATEEIETRIDWLSLSWDAVLAAVESHVSTTIRVGREKGLIVRG